MTKQNQIQDNTVPLLGTYNYENLFNVYVNEDGLYYYNLLKNLYFPESLIPTIYNTVNPLPGELLPQLSYRMYNVVNLWWAIAGANNINNPLEPLDPAVPLKIISSSVVRSIITGIQER